MALACAPLLAGCVARSDLDTIEHKQLSLREMIANDRQQMNALQENIARLNDRVTELQHGGKLGSGETRQIASINGRLARLEAQMSAMQSAGAPSGMPGPPGMPGMPTPPGAPPEAGGHAPGAMPPPSPAAVAVPGWHGALDQELATSANSSEPGASVYRAGLMDMKAGKYNEAIAKFKAFQRGHQKSPLAEPAEYFSANALFELGARDPGSYNQAILQFNDLAMRYPKGRFAANAQLREAQAFLRTNDPLDARLTLQKLVRDYPGTPEASTADAMIKSLASE